MARWQWAVVFSTVLMLPACLFQPHKSVQKKSSQHPDGDGSIFASVSEESIREEVCACTSAAEPPIQFLTRKESRTRAKKLTLERARQRQAQLVDIPVPLNVKPLPDFFVQGSATSHQACSLGYTVELSTDQVLSFYQQEMERHGWRLMASGRAGQEALEYFVKPDRFCSVSIRPHVGKSNHKKEVVEIVIFTGLASRSV
jgi:hypothetical protein